MHSVKFASLYFGSSEHSGSFCCKPYMSVLLPGKCHSYGMGDHSCCRVTAFFVSAVYLTVVRALSTSFA